MITSKELMEITEVSRATLNNYIAAGLLPKPEVKRISPAPGEPLTTLGYFPDWAIDRIKSIQQMKQQGHAMGEIIAKLSQDGSRAARPTTRDQGMTNVSTPQLATEAPQVEENENSKNKLNQYDNKYLEGNTLKNSLAFDRLPQLSIENLPYPTYLMSYEGQFLWLNPEAQQLLFPNGHIPEHIENRSVIKALANWSDRSTGVDLAGILKNHFGMIKSRFDQIAFDNHLQHFPTAHLDLIKSAFATASLPSNPMFHDDFFNCGPLGEKRVVATSFREGILISYIPSTENKEEILEWLSQRDQVIRYLLGKRLPVLTPVAALVADLQGSVRICSELPPDEYFQLINEIWSTLDPIFRQHYGAYGKHTGDGMVYYFFPQPDSNYLMNAVQCAAKIKEAVRTLSHKWLLEKGWANQLYMNIGLSEGEEWLGTFKTNTNYELVVLGDTINVAGRLSDLARYGSIWATKNLISKLNVEDRNLIDFGVIRKGLDQDVFVKNSFAQVSSILDEEKLRTSKLSDIGGLAVTEIKGITG